MTDDIELPPPTPPADDRPRWNIPHASTIRCLYAAIERLYAGDTPAEVFEDYGWSVTTTPPADARKALALMDAADDAVTRRDWERLMTEAREVLRAALEGR
jgi:hypothetical protein